MASDASQSQSQSQNITISVHSSGNPDLEQRIFGDVHSAGRQLGRLSAVVELLLTAHETDPALTATPQAQQAVHAFRQVQQDIERTKAGLRDPETLLGELQALKAGDPAAFAGVRERLSDLVRLG